MNYIGSKLSLLNFIDETIDKLLKNDKKYNSSKDIVFADLFAGTGVVGDYYKRLGYKIISNDIQYYSYVLNRHRIGNSKNLEFKELSTVIPELKNETDYMDKQLKVLSTLNDLPGVEGFIFNNYCSGGTKGEEHERMYFSDYNGKKCDAIRIQIEEWKEDEMINADEYFALLAALIDSIDKYANTASVYGAFLKKLKKSADKEMVLSPYGSLVTSEHENEVYNEDVNLLIKKIKGDILYLDPPYNHRQYATNYHILETIAKYDDPFIYGKTGLRKYEDQKSLYCSKTKAVEAFEDLIDNANFKYIILSYNDEGIIPISEVERIFRKKGKYELFQTDYKRFKADKTENRNHKKDSTVEYLHCVTCN